MAQRHPLIAREGWIHIAVVALAAAVVHGLAGAAWAAPLWVLLVFVLQFFRDPPRTVAGGPGTVVAPADGRVVFVGPARDPYLDRDSLKVSIFMNVFNVHANRTPVAGTVVGRWYHAGSFLNAALDKASAENERNALHLRGDDGTDVVCVQVAGLVARRILCYVEPGARVERGERYGFIRFGSRVDVYLPVSSTVRAQLGERLHGGSDIIATLVH